MGNPTILVDFFFILCHSLCHPRVPVLSKARFFGPMTIAPAGAFLSAFPVLRARSLFSPLQRLMFLIFDGKLESGL
jgi:hypothetical protein